MDSALLLLTSDILKLCTSARHVNMRVSKSSSLHEHSRSSSLPLHSMTIAMHCTNSVVVTWATFEYTHLNSPWMLQLGSSFPHLLFVELKCTNIPVLLVLKRPMRPRVCGKVPSHSHHLVVDVVKANIRYPEEVKREAISYLIHCLFKCQEVLTHGINYTTDRTSRKMSIIICNTPSQLTSDKIVSPTALYAANLPLETARQRNTLQAS